MCYIAFQMSPMMKPVHIPILLLGLLSTALHAQGPPIEWQVSLGGSLLDIGHAVRQTAQGEYLIVGETNSMDGDVTNNLGSVDGWWIRLGSDGTLLDQHTYGGSGDDRFNTLVATSDGGSLLVGATNSTDGDVSGLHGIARDIWVAKVNTLGVLQWQRTLGGIANDDAYSAIQVSDGGFVILGAANSFDGDVTGHHGLGTMADFWVVKLDNSGELIWEHSYGGTSNDRGYCIMPTADGGFIMAGQTFSSDGEVTGQHGQNDAWLVKMDSAGNLEWQRAYGGSSEDIANAVLQLPDGGYVVAGSTSSTNGDVSNSHGALDAWVVRLDGTGAILWQRALGGSGSDAFNAMDLDVDGGLILAGQTTSNNGNVGQLHGAQDAWVVKLDLNGAILWQKTMGGILSDAFMDIVTTSDGGHILTGRSASADGDVTANAGSDDVWVVRLASQVGIHEHGAEVLTIWPNPSQGRIHFPSARIAQGKRRLVLSDATGRFINERTLLPGIDEADLGRQAPGVYFLSLYTESSVRRGQLVME